MRILIINTLYEPYRIGGAEISVQVIAQELKKNGIEVAVLSLGEVDEDVQINEVQVWRLKLQNIFWPFTNKNKKSKISKLKWHYRDIYNNRYSDNVNRIINKFKPDIVHTNNLMGFSVAIWDLIKKRDIKIVHTLRDYYLQCPKTNKFKTNNSCFKQCLECNVFSKKKKNISHSVDAVVGISNSILKSHIDEGYFKESIKEVIYNGFEVSSKNLLGVCFDKNSFLKFGFMGQINEAKGIEVLVRNLKAFDEYNNWKLLIAGNIETSYKNYLLSQLPQNKIEFIGYVNQEIFFNKIDVLVVPSIWEEPFGRVVLEGLINNVPVLGSKKGGIQELLSNNTEFLFNPLNGELRNLLEVIIKSPDKLNTFSFDNDILNKFSIENMIKKYTNLYLKLKE